MSNPDPSSTFALLSVYSLESGAVAVTEVPSKYECPSAITPLVVGKVTSSFAFNKNDRCSVAWKVSAASYLENTNVARAVTYPSFFTLTA